MRKSVIRTIAIAMLISVLLVIPAFAENATVTASDVNFRSGPGTGYSILDCLPKGASVTVTDRSNSSWYAVNYNGRDGFMSSMYLSVQADNSGENGGADSHCGRRSSAGYDQRHVCPFPQRPVHGFHHIGRV